MFVLDQSAAYFWPVVVKLASDGGKFERHQFDVEFKRLPQSRINELVDGLQKDEVTSMAISKEVVLGWKAVKDSNGNDVPFSDQALDKLLNVPAVATAIGHAWFDSISGGKIKN